MSLQERLRITDDQMNAIVPLPGLPDLSDHQTTEVPREVSNIFHYIFLSYVIQYHSGIGNQLLQIKHGTRSTVVGLYTTGKINTYNLPCKLQQVRLVQCQAAE